MQKNIEKILTAHLDKKYYEYGFADLKGLLVPELSSFRCGIAILRKLDNEIINDITKGPTLKYFNLYNDINDELTGKITVIEGELQALGIHARGMHPTKSDGELNGDSSGTLRTDFSHKMTGTRAGLGWIGKTDLFISEKYGPRIRLASILIDADVSPDREPVSESRCGACDLCVKACPSGAATGAPWNTTLDRDVFFDAFKCREHCRYVSRKNIDKEISLCGICVSVCPVGIKNKI
ncbi:MAG: epoxyqueuosine reductase [Spirochaetae bacterium HGW-Spirochaetae-1]|jgi:epoxyqueuosine reductase QueG|nr:MAG: epoxyqueuosine reductase [Spirochaetae bacterium HGW-Spirochaetae-1]